tara:strand:- start:48 stop:281 length:234 start_codon:yes stop_codon:yes gene_type:complete
MSIKSLEWVSPEEVELVMKYRAESAAHRALQEAIEGHDYAMNAKKNACIEYNRTAAILKRAQVENEHARGALTELVI